VAGDRGPPAPHRPAPGAQVWAARQIPSAWRGVGFPPSRRPHYLRVQLGHRHGRGTAAGRRTPSLGRGDHRPARSRGTFPEQTLTFPGAGLRARGAVRLAGLRQAALPLAGPRAEAGAPAAPARTCSIPRCHRCIVGVPAQIVAS
jgi:hypothetical protein